MKELWPLEENKYIFLFYGETVLNWLNFPLSATYLE